MTPEYSMNSPYLTSAAGLAYNHIKNSIADGLLRPQERIGQEAVASDLGLSRAPIREALNQLEREGLVLLRARRGFAVSSLEVNDVEEIFQIRMLLEEHAARLATRNRSSEDVAEVRRLVQALDEATAQRPINSREWASLNREFHTALCQASGLKRLEQITLNLRDLIEHCVRIDATSEENVGSAQKDHLRIFDAFAAGDDDQVAQLIREHCQAACDRLTSSLQILAARPGQQSNEVTAIRAEPT